MVTARRHDLDRRLVGALIVLAIVVRAAAVLVLQSHKVPRSTYEHGEIAANLLAGRGFSVRFLGAEGPTSQQAPLYPFLVAGAYALGGVETPRALLILELGQSLLGGLLVASVIMLAREVAPGCSRCTAPRRLDRRGSSHADLRGDSRPGGPPGRHAVDSDSRLGLPNGPDTSARDAVVTGLALAVLALTDPILTLAAAGVIGTVGLGRGPGKTQRVLPIIGVGQPLLGVASGSKSATPRCTASWC